MSSLEKKADVLYTVTFQITGEYFANESFATLSCKAGEQIAAPAAPEHEGYTFSGWQNLPQTMPEQNLVVTGFYTRNEEKPEQTPDPTPVPTPVPHPRAHSGPGRRSAGRSERRQQFRQQYGPGGHFRAHRCGVRSDRRCRLAAGCAERSGTGLCGGTGAAAP